MDRFWRGKRVLITGANGFLGSHLSIELLKKGTMVIGIIKENLEISFLNIALKQMHQVKIKIIKSDIVNFRRMFAIFKEFNPDICLHIAAQPIVGIANKSPLDTFEANIKGTWNILEMARLCNTKAVIVASSDKAYGEHKKLPLTEEASLNALHPYDSSKACADILTRCYTHTFGLNAAVTRCANIYGPGDFNFSRIIPDTIRSIILNRNPIIRSDGTPLRDYVFIKDVVYGYLLLAEKLYQRKIKSGEAFNLGTGRPISVLPLVRKIINISGKNNLIPNIRSKHKIKGEIDRQYLSGQKAIRLLGWRRRYSLRAGLETTYQWYTEHLCQSH